MSTNGPGDPPQRVTIDEDGDLTLLVGEELTGPTREFIVCSSTMRRASPVWKRMLFGGFQESKPAEGQWVVALPEDDPGPLTHLLHLVHANVAEDPRRLDLASLYKLMVLMDKYDTFRFARLWKDNWLATVKGVSRAESGSTLCMAAYVALRMGAESTAFSIVAYMSKYATLGFQGLAVFGDSIYENLDTAGSHSVSEMIRQMREYRIRNVLDITWRTTNKAMERPGPFQTGSSPDYDFLGRLWVAQTGVRGAPLPKLPNLISESPVDLVSSLSEIVGAMGTPQMAGPHMASLKTALQHLNDASMRTFWKMDSELMKDRRKVTDVTEKLGAIPNDETVLPVFPADNTTVISGKGPNVHGQQNSVGQRGS